jgi:hypothetical protein
MKWYTFYGKWFCTAFWNAFGIASAVGFALTVAGGAWAYFQPNANPTVTLMIWLIPLFVFLGTAAVALICAPYVMYRGLEQSTSDTISSLTNQIKAANRRPVPGEGEHELRTLAKEALQFSGSSPMDCREWREKASACTRRRLKPLDAGEFDEIWPRYEKVPYSPASARCQAYLLECSSWLQAWAPKASDSNINPNDFAP